MSGRTLVRSVLSLLLLTFPITALGTQIDPGWYFSAGVGASKPDKGFLDTKKQKQEVNTPPISYKMSPAYDAKIGYRINRFVRVDANAQYRLIRMNDAVYKPLHARSASAMLNVYLDANNYSIITPYITAGLGMNIFNVAYKDKTTSAQQIFVKSSITQRAINVGAGLQVQFDENFGIDFIYKWTDLGMLKISPNPDNTLSGTKPIKHTLSLHEAFINFVIFM